MHISVITENTLKVSSAFIVHMCLVTVIYNLFTFTGNTATAKVMKTVTSSQITTPSQAGTEFAILMTKIVKELQQNEDENLVTIKSICSFLTIGSDSGTLLFNENQRVKK